MFITVFYGILHIPTGIIRYCSAGHTPPFVLKANGKQDMLRQEKPCCPLGIIPEADYSVHELSLSDGDILFVYSDGITEAFNAEKEMYGETRLADCLKRSGNGTARHTSDCVIGSVQAFSNGVIQSDDITVLGIKVFI